MRFFHTILICSVLALLMPASASAEGNIHVGQLKIDPFLSISETVDDNIYFTSTDAQKDTITTIKPGLRLQLPFRIHQADLEYYSVFTRYDKHTEENTTDDHVKGNLGLHFGSLFGLKLSDQYVKGHEGRESSPTGAIEKYKTNTASASATYELTDLSKIEIDYAPTTWRFETSTFRDRDENLISAYVFYRVFRKTSAFIEYDRKTTTFSQSGLDLDNTMDSMLLGLTWDISRRSKGTIKYGTVHKDFTSSSRQAFTGWTSSVELRHNFTGNTAVQLTGQRIINETNLQGEPYFITTGASAQLDHWFTRKVVGIVRGSYGEDQYPDVLPSDTEARLERTRSSGVGLKYTIKDWLELTLDYNIRTRHSNIEEIDYKEHATAITVNISL